MNFLFRLAHSRQHAWGAIVFLGVAATLPFSPHARAQPYASSVSLKHPAPFALGSITSDEHDAFGGGDCQRGFQMCDLATDRWTVFIEAIEAAFESLAFKWSQLHRNYDASPPMA